MPRITSMEEAGYKIIPPAQEELNKEFITILPDKNINYLPDPKLLLVKENQINKNYFSYSLDKIDMKPPSLPDVFLIKQVSTDKKNFYQKENIFKLVTPNVNILKNQLTKNLENVSINVNFTKIPESEIKSIAPDTNIKKSYIKKLIPIVPNTNFTEIPRRNIINIVPNTNFTKKLDTNIIFVSPNTNFSEITNKDIILVNPNVNKNTILNKSISYVSKNVNNNLEAFKSIVTTEPNLNNQKLLSAGIVPINENKISSSTIGDQKNTVEKNKNENYKEISKPTYSNNVDDPKKGYEGALESFINHLHSFGDRMNPINWLKKGEDLLKSKLNQMSQSISNEAAKFVYDFEKVITYRSGKLIENAIKNPIDTLKNMPENINDVFYNSAKDGYNMVEERYSKVSKKYNEIANRWGLPQMKQMAPFPTQEEFMAKAKGEAADKLKESFVDSVIKEAKSGDTVRDNLPDDNPFKRASTPPKDNTYSYNKSAPMMYIHTSQLMEGISIPMILDNLGKPTPDIRDAGTSCYIYNGFRESPWTGVSDNIFKGKIGFQGVPDIWHDIRIEPCTYLVTTDKPRKYAPPKYPFEQLGGYMLSNFEVRDVQMNTEENWDLGAFGTIPLGSSMVLPSNLSISFAADADLLTHKWILAVMEYMFGSNYTVHAMRPYKMCCYNITVYTITFYGETLYARTYIAYPLFNFSTNMLGSGSIKIFETDWVIVGLREYSIKPKQELQIIGNGVTNELSATMNYAHGSTEEQQGNIADTTKAYLENLKSSDSIKKAALKIYKSEAVQAIAKATGLDKIINKFITKNAKHIVCSFCDVVVAPCPSNTVSGNFTYVAKRFLVNDELGNKRARDFVLELISNGVDPDNIKVIVGSADGVPGLDHFLSSERGWSYFQTGDFFIGGIYMYDTDADTMGYGSSEAPEIKNGAYKENRRCDLLNLEGTYDNCPNFYEELVGSTKSADDAWNKIPKISYGRQLISITGRLNDKYASSNPISSSINTNFLNWEKTFPKDEKLKTFYPGYVAGSNSATTTSMSKARSLVSSLANTNVANVLTSNQNTSSEKIEKLKEAEQSYYKINQEISVNGLDDSLYKEYEKEFLKIEELKTNTNNLTEDTILYETYEMQKIIEYTDVFNKNLTWWRTTFGSNRYRIDNKDTTTLEQIENGTWTLNFPQNSASKNLIPCLKIYLMSNDFLKNDKKTQFLLNMYFSSHSNCWIYNTYKDTLTLYIKKEI